MGAALLGIWGKVHEFSLDQKKLSSRPTHELSPAHPCQSLILSLHPYTLPLVSGLPLVGTHRGISITPFSLCLSHGLGSNDAMDSPPWSDLQAEYLKNNADSCSGTDNQPPVSKPPLPYFATGQAFQFPALSYTEKTSIQWLTNIQERRWSRP